MTERERLDQINIASELFREGLISSSEYTRSISNINSEIIKNKTNNSEMKQGLKIEYINKSSAYGDSRYYVYYIDNNAVFMANQIPWPNCCGIAILKDLSISPSVDKTIFKKILDEICDDLYSNDKYSKLLFYTNIGSASRMFETYPDITILDPFKNRRSGNILIGFEFNLLKDSDVNSGSRQPWPITIEEAYEDQDDEDDDDFEEDDDDEDQDVTRATVAQQAILDGFPEPTPDVYDYGRRGHIVYGSPEHVLSSEYRIRLSTYIIEPDSNESTNTR